MLRLRCYLNACFLAGPGCGGQATGMSQLTFEKRLLNEADLPCHCPVLTLCMWCTRGGQFVHVAQTWVDIA